MKPVFIGWDPREEAAYAVAKSSIERRTQGVNVTPLMLANLAGILDRPIENKDGKLWCPISQAPMATEFAISRFAVPFLRRSGWALFADCDIICQSDLEELFDHADERYAVMVVKHTHTIGDALKMDGQIQTFYRRKNWSSVMLWNCGHKAHRDLTYEALNNWPGRDLHAFKWLADDLIGPLPVEWNYLVGVNPEPFPKRGILHLTLGGPWIRGWKGGHADELWESERKLIYAK